MAVVRDRLPKVERLSVGIAGGAFLVGVVVAFVASPVEGLIVGLLAEITAETLNASYKERDYELRLTSLSRVPRGPDLASKLAQVGASIAESPRADYLRAELQLRIAEFEGHLDQIGRGRVLRDGGDIQDLLRCTMECQGDLRATTTLRAASAEEGTSWWSSRLGAEYWELNRAALERGVRISRIFLVDEISPAVLTLMAKQADAGVEVRYAIDSTIPVALRSNVIIWDASLAWRAQMDTTGVISQNRIYTRPSDVEQLEAVYLACRTRSLELPALSAVIPEAPVERELGGAAAVSPTTPVQPLVGPPAEAVE